MPCLTRPHTCALQGQPRTLTGPRTYSYCIFARLSPSAPAGSTTAVELLLYDTSTWLVATSVNAAITKTWSNLCVAGITLSAGQTLSAALWVTFGGATGAYHFDSYSVDYEDPSPSPVPAAAPGPGPAPVGVVTQFATSFEAGTSSFWVGVGGAVAATQDWASAAARNTGDRGLSVVISGGLTGNTRDVALQAGPPESTGHQPAAAVHGISGKWPAA